MTELPEGLNLADYSGAHRIFIYYEDPTSCDFSANVEFIIRRDGRVEITTVGAPCVPADVLHFITVQADRLRGGTDADSTG